MFGERARREAAEARALAQDARDRAASADARMDRHEAVCAERWSEIKMDMGDMKRLVQRVMLAIIGAAGVVLYDILKAKGIL